MADDGAPQRGAVALRGYDWDLERVGEHLRGPIRVTKGADGWELAADVFESMDSGNDVAQASRKLCSQEDPHVAPPATHGDLACCMTGECPGDPAVSLPLVPV